MSAKKNNKTKYKVGDLFRIGAGSNNFFGTGLVIWTKNGGNEEVLKGDYFMFVGQDELQLEFLNQKTGSILVYDNDWFNKLVDSYKYISHVA